MDTQNFENNDRKIESVYSTRIRAGKRRTYFFDVRATRANDYFLTITESRKRFDNNGYDRHKIFLYKEDFNKFLKAITEALDYVKTELMPDFDFDAFNHDEVFSGDDEEGTQATDRNKVASNPAPVVAVDATTPIADTDVHADEDIVVKEAKQLEARETHASKGDNLSNEEVDKW